MSSAGNVPLYLGPLTISMSSYRLYFNPFMNNNVPQLCNPNATSNHCIQNEISEHLDSMSLLPLFMID